MEAAWDISTGSPTVVVAVVDTGVSYENYTDPISGITYYQAPDLACTSFTSPYDFVDGDTHANDDNRHGTHVTGTIAGCANNGLGVASVAPDATIMPVKVLNSIGSGTYADIATGIIYAADNGADIINLSLGGPFPSTTLYNALAYASNKGVVIVCSTVGYPAGYNEYCMPVGATRYDETRPAYSNYGNKLSVVAPGGDLSVDQDGNGYGDGVLQQTFNGNFYLWGYWFFEGTSMAAPHVSGVAPLLISTGVTDPAVVRTCIESTAKDLGPLGFDADYGYGLVDAEAALYCDGVFNSPPMALNGNGTFNEDIPGNITLSYTDNDGPGPYIISIATPPHHGQLIENGAPNQYIYTPDFNYIGADAIEWLVNDGMDDSNTATFSLVVNATPPANVSPMVNNQTESITEDNPINLTLVCNDTDGPGLNLFTIISPPSNGVLTSTGTSGNYTYTPNANSNGPDSFEWQCNDRLADSNSATVSLNVQAVNDFPNFTQDPFPRPDATEEQAYNTSISGMATDVDGDVLSYSKVSGPAWLNVLSDGTLEGAPEAGDVGLNPWTVEVSDGNGSDQATLNINVTAALASPPASEQTFVSIAAEDGWVRESSENSNVGGKRNSGGAGSKAIRMGDEKKDRQYKSIVSFDTSSIPDGATIMSARLK